MTRTNGAVRSGDTQTGKIIFLIGEEQPERLQQLLGSYLRRPEVERVVLLTLTSDMAARVAAPYADARESGRLATVLAWGDIDGALRAASRGWGAPDVMLGTPLGALPASYPLGMAAD